LPSEKVLAKKKSQVNDLANEFKETLVGILADYRGISVDQDTKLRRDLREAGVIYRVLKNNIIRRALEQAEISGLDDQLFGTTSLAISKTSYSDAARILCEFSKKNEFYKIKAGFVEGKCVHADEIKALSKLPSKEQLLAQVLCGLQSPIRGFACVLNGVPRSFVVVLSKIASLKSN